MSQQAEDVNTGSHSTIVHVTKCARSGWWTR